MCECLSLSSLAGFNLGEDCLLTAELLLSFIATLHLMSAPAEGSVSPLPGRPQQNTFQSAVPKLQNSQEDCKDRVWNTVCLPVENPAFVYMIVNILTHIAPFFSVLKFERTRRCGLASQYIPSNGKE